MHEVKTGINSQKSKIETNNLILYSTGKTISIFGSAIYNFALGLYILEQTGSALSFAITLLLGVLPMILFNPFAGVIADKLNKKALVVLMDLLSGVVLFSLYILCSTNYELNLIFIYAATLLLTIFATFFGIGLEAAKPNIVTEEKLMTLNSISKIIDSVSSILGPMLGGIIFAFVDIKTFFLINGISFILSGLSMILIDFQFVKNRSIETHSAKKIHFISDIREGLHYLINQKNIMNLFTVLVSINFFLGFAVTVPLPYIINIVLHLSSKQLGIIQGAFPVGMVFGALFVKKITKAVSYPLLLNYAGSSLALLMMILGIPVLLKDLQLNSSIYVFVYMVILFFFGIVIAFIDIPLAYIIQKEIPDEYRGRVLSIGLSFGKIMLPIAMIFSGALLSSIPSYVMPIAGGIAFYLVTLRSSRKLRIDNLLQKANTC